MNRPHKLLIVLALLWAAFAPAYLCYRDARDEQYRALRALAGARLGASAEEYATNATIRIPRESVETVSNLAQTEERRSSTFTTIAWVSSGFILLLSLSSWRTTQIPITPPFSGVGESPKSKIQNEKC